MAVDTLTVGLSVVLFGIVLKWLRSNLTFPAAPAHIPTQPGSTQVPACAWFVHVFET
jgi:hypothetical protein